MEVVIKPNGLSWIKRCKTVVSVSRLTAGRCICLKKSSLESDSKVG